MLLTEYNEEKVMQKERQEGKREVAVNLIHKGQMTDADIADVCGLTEDQVKKLREQEMTMA